jgi:hypothetical protein
VSPRAKQTHDLALLDRQADVLNGDRVIVAGPDILSSSMAVIRTRCDRGDRPGGPVPALPQAANPVGITNTPNTRMPPYTNRPTPPE